MKKSTALTMLWILVCSITFAQRTPEVGTVHNQVIAYLDTYDFTGKTQDDVLDDVLYFTGRQFDAGAFPAGNRGIWGEIYFCGSGNGIPDTRDTYEQILDTMVLRGKITNASETFLASLISETENLPDYTSFVNKIDELTAGYDVNSLPAGEKDIVSGSISVLKSSGALWNSYYDPSDTTLEEGRFSFRCFFCVAKRDLLGALLGFLAGNCLCAKLGVANPAICGAVGAAALGALYSWAAKVCPEHCSSCKKPRVGTYPSWICHLPF